MIFVSRFLCRSVAMAFLGNHMQQHWSLFLVVPQVFQNRQQVIKVMAINRADIKETHFLEQGATGYHATGIFLCPPGCFFNGAWELFRHFLGEMADRPVRLR